MTTGSAIADPVKTDASPTTEIGESLKEVAESLHQAVSKAVPAVSEQLKKAADHLPEPSEAINRLRSLVEERPLTAILCAAGIGVVAALCLRR